MNQMTFSDMEYSGRKKATQKEKFLRLMNRIILWDEWVKKIQPFYPSGKRGRPPRGIEVMLRIYLLQIWFNLSDTGLEDAIYDSYAFQLFIGINFLEEQVPDYAAAAQRTSHVRLLSDAFHSIGTKSKFCMVALSLCAAHIYKILNYFTSQTHFCQIKKP